MKNLLKLALKRSGFDHKLIERHSILTGTEILSIPGRVLSNSKVQEEAGNFHLAIRFYPHKLVTFSEEFFTKPLFRFDFRNEWNNLGYGKVDITDSIFTQNGEVIADIVNLHTNQKISDYIVLFSDSIWCLREQGPIDGYDWTIFENFLNQYAPKISEIPFEYKAAATMRIDCDEAVASGRDLFELYKKNNFPFSLAIKTQQELRENDLLLMKDVIAAKGSIVSHSHTHAPNWGGSAASAIQEMRDSHQVFKKLNISGLNYDYVVSPFHQNSQEAVQGLREYGVKGFVGGIICNDPEYILARGGVVPFVDGIISHTQQCMFHGETYHFAANSLEIYKKAFRQAFETETFFGFLDHPFSSYSYGWYNEKERLIVHEDFLNYLTSFDNLWRASLEEALGFIEMKSTIQIREDEKSFTYQLPFNERFAKRPNVKIQFKNKNYKLSLGGQVVISK